MAFYKHGHTVNRNHSSTYKSWAAMKKRCVNESSQSYALYGGRGITVCERWLDFENFLADMGERPSEKHTLHRVNNDEDYQKENCRWVTFRIQNHAKNFPKRRSNNASKYRGVSFHPKIEKWEARCCNKIMGYFTNEIEAAEAYNLAAKLSFGDYAMLNEI